MFGLHLFGDPPRYIVPGDTPTEPCTRPGVVGRFFPGQPRYEGQGQPPPACESRGWLTLWGLFPSTPQYVGPPLTPGDPPMGENYPSPSDGEIRIRIERLR